MKKLRAFTIMELLVALTLTSLLVLAAWYAFELIQKQYVLQKNLNKNISTYIQLETRLKQDLETMKFLKRDLQQIIFKSSNYQIEYDFQYDFVSRKHSLSEIEADTFFVKNELQNSFFQNREQSVGIIDQLEIAFFPFEEKRVFILKKQYSVADLMNEK